MGKFIDKSAVFVLAVVYFVAAKSLFAFEISDPYAYFALLCVFFWLGIVILYVGYLSLRGGRDDK